MDDLAGLDWSVPSKQTSTPNPPPNFPPYRQNPTPQLSGRSTPLSAQASGLSGLNRPLKVSPKPATPANDSFASLVSLNPSKAGASNLSLSERQRQLQEEKNRQEAERRKQYDAQFGGNDSQWNTLGSAKTTPEPAALGLQPPHASVNTGSSLSKTINKPFAGLDTSAKRAVQSPPAEDDLLSAFNSAAPVDSSSHFPPATSFGSGRSTPAQSANLSRGVTPNLPTTSANAFEDDDDMFGLKSMTPQPSASAPPAAHAAGGDDDILGLLSKPVSEFEQKPAKARVAQTQRTETPEASSPDLDNPQAKAVAELVDMGFPADKSAIALATTESGLDVQAAVGYLLNQAHAEAKQKTSQRRDDGARHSPEVLEDRSRRSAARGSSRDTSAGRSKPSWMQEEARSRSGQRRQDGQSSSQEKDVSQYASEIGSSLFKSANSLWKTGRKQVQKAVADFQQDGDPNMPKWMRDAQAANEAERSARPSRPRAAENATDEAMMLESGGRPTKPSRPSAARQYPESQSARPRQADSKNGLPDRTMTQSPASRQQTPTLDKRPAARLTRQDVEEQAAQAYISPARRKKTTPQPDLLAESRSEPPAGRPRQTPPAQSNNPFLQAANTAKARPAVSATPPRPKAPPRQIPPVSSSALNTSASFRQKGSEAFKRGDYSAAHTAYSSALGPLPSTHPVTIIVLCNRAVTNIKVGDPKAAVSDADAALAIIGISRGEGEKIAPGGTEADKDMKEFYGRALMRKAEALENMEKWTDAGKVWKEAVEAGVGGSISIQGRNRCEKASGNANRTNTPAASARPAVRSKPPPRKPSALSDLGGVPGADSEAVKKLKAANAAAEKADDEKFALTDQVDAKLVAWKGSKADNLRALLGSLDNVLWPEAGWKKVGMGDLVMPNKVKIVYMKAIAKVHPDKISQSATTEQRMISAAVFATLNEAWDKFKTDNGL